MKKLAGLIFLIAVVSGVFAQDLSYRMEELTAPDFVKAVEKSSRTCIIPIGVFEKHGAQLPLGTDLYMAREYALRAAEQEYTIVFPWYYFSQINEARHQPGTIAYSPELIWKVLQETLDELSRNGFDKIILVNGHGGNNAFLNYFGMAQLSERRNYSLYWFRPERNKEVAAKAERLSQADNTDSHAGNSETSMMEAVKPDITHPERSAQQSGMDQERLKHLEKVYTGIWWYASFPNHYGGNGSGANAEAGELLINDTVGQLVELIRQVKNDEAVPALQNKFFNEADEPLKTGQ